MTHRGDSMPADASADELRACKTLVLLRLARIVYSVVCGMTAGQTVLWQPLAIAWPSLFALAFSLVTLWLCVWVYSLQVQTFIEGCDQRRRAARAVAADCHLNAEGCPPAKANPYDD